MPSSSASPAVAAHPLRMDFTELRVRHVGLTPAHTLRTLRLRGLAMPSTSASVKWALQPTSQGCCEEPVMRSESAQPGAWHTLLCCQ